LKRQLLNSEKEALLSVHGRKCFIDGEPIPEDEPMEFHHIRPYSEGGTTTPDNIAPVCRRHHLTIGTMSLQEYRDKIELEQMFKSGEAIYLDGVIRKRDSPCGRRMNYESADNLITLYCELAH
jgi:5-methylcytosine-specific restriction endonuclease McrA